MKIKTQLKAKRLSSQNHFRPLALAVAMAFTGSLPAVTQAATYAVHNTNDSGFGSLRRAISDANDVTPNQLDTIEFAIPVGSTTNLESELFITDSVIIKGPTVGDVGSIILDGGGANRHVNAGGFARTNGKSLYESRIT